VYPLWLKLQRGQKADPNNVGCHRVVEAARLPVIENLVNAGANGYLLKDDALSTSLVTAVRTVYIGGACFSPEDTRAIMERRRERPQPDVLTEREKEILAHAIRYADSDNTVIASALGITSNTDAVLGGVAARACQSFESCRGGKEISRLTTVPPPVRAPLVNCPSTRTLHSSMFTIPNCLRFSLSAPVANTCGRPMPSSATKSLRARPSCTTSISTCVARACLAMLLRLSLSTW